MGAGEPEVEEEIELAARLLITRITHDRACYARRVKLARKDLRQPVAKRTALYLPMVRDAAEAWAREHAGGARGLFPPAARVMAARHFAVLDRGRL